VVNAQSILPKQRSLANAEKRNRGYSLIDDGAVPRLDYIEAQNRLFRRKQASPPLKTGSLMLKTKLLKLRIVTSIEKEIAGQAQQVVKRNKLIKLLVIRLRSALAASKV